MIPGFATMRFGRDPDEIRPWLVLCYVCFMLRDRVGLPARQYEMLAASVARHHTLADVIAWGVAQIPECIVAEVVVQDEYTHDVVLPYRDGMHLVYDTT